MELSTEQKKKFVDYLNGKWTGSQLCPICKVDEWFIPDLIHEMPEAKHKGKFQFSPLIQIICLNCGHTLLFNAIVAGIYIKEKEEETKDKQAINETRSDPTKDNASYMR